MMATEHFSTRFQDIDTWPSLDVLSAFYEGQLSAVAAVRSSLPTIAAAAEEAAARLRRGGRLVYVGAGTSGRIGVQDGTELPPTFNWPDDQLVYLIAGGDRAIMKAVENAEDSVEEGTAGIRNHQIGPNDVVIGIAASGRTPFTIAALKEAASRGAQTIGISNNTDAPILDACSHPILADTGEEVIAGSTRMKAGTAQKVILNLLSSLIMVRMGRVYRGLMVNMRATNAKLRRRSEIMVMQITDCDEATAADAILQANGDLKTAVLIATGATAQDAQEALARHDGNLRQALADSPGLKK
jgi:N-acetylmuramic acid 6-phosphate etherase